MIRGVVSANHEPLGGGLRLPGPALPARFGALPDALADGKTARAVVLPAGYEATTSYGTGTKDGPEAILHASRSLELYDDELEWEPCEVGIATAPAWEFDRSAPERPIAQVETLVGGALDAGKFPILLGGEHAITLGGVRAALARHPGLGVLQLDAHADLRDTYEGSPFSHACVMRRVAEIAPIVAWGIRSLSAEEAAWRPERSYRRFTAERVLRDPGTTAAVVAALPPEVYVTIDVDVLDPSAMPAVGTPEPGGPGWYDVLRLLRAVFAARRVVVVDVVELAPLAGMIAPDFLGAKLVYKVISYRFGSLPAGPTSGR
jgi:agmatinase